VKVMNWRGSSGVGLPRAEGCPNADDGSLLFLFWVWVSSFHGLTMDMYFLGDDLH
jgi:hypothetical protein